MQLIGRTDSYKVLINYRAQRHVETCLCWKGRDSGDYLLFQRPGPREQDKEILNGNIAPFWQNSVQYVYLTGRWKPFFRTQTFSIARKMTESLKKSKQRRKELIYVAVIYTQFKYRVKMVKWTNKEAFRRPFCCPVSATNGLFNSCVYPWQLQAICSAIIIM